MNDELTVEVELTATKTGELLKKKFQKCERCGKAVLPAKYKNKDRYKFEKENQCSCANRAGKF